MSLVTPERALDLVGRAMDGDQAAWDQLVEDLTPLLWGVARGHGLATPDAADVVQTTWLRLAENLHRLRDPERVSAWLVTTARREALRVVKGTQRSTPVDSHLAPVLVELECDDENPEAPILRAEEDRRLWGAFKTLPTLCRSLLRVLIVDPAPSYAEVSAALDMPVGSIGPRRQRCLQRLRAVLTDDPGAPDDDLRCEA